MNIITRTIIGCTAALIALAAVSCSKDTTIRYNNATMGNIVSGRFVSDQGNTFNVVEQNCIGKLDSSSATSSTRQKVHPRNMT